MFIINLCWNIIAFNSYRIQTCSSPMRTIGNINIIWHAKHTVRVNPGSKPNLISIRDPINFAIV